MSNFDLRSKEKLARRKLALAWAIILFASAAMLLIEYVG